MNALKTSLKIFKDEGWRIFALAIFASLLWHLFWLSTISIVSKPDSSRPVKFSKVSFLGPLFSKSAMQLQAAPKERSFLEVRYINALKSLSRQPEKPANPAAGRYETGNGANHLKDGRIIASIDERLRGEKLEPSPGEE